MKRLLTLAVAIAAACLLLSPRSYAQEECDEYGCWGPNGAFFEHVGRATSGGSGAAAGGWGDGDAGGAGGRIVGGYIVGAAINAAGEFIADLFGFGSSGSSSPAPPSPPPWPGSTMPVPTEENIEEAKKLGAEAGENFGDRAGRRLADEAADGVISEVFRLAMEGALTNQGPDRSSQTAAQQEEFGGDKGTEDSDSDPVDLRHGEFGYTSTDVEIEGSHAFRFVRTYRNRVNFWRGPFGPSWDHNYDARVFETPSNNQNAFLCDSEVQVSLGDLRVIRMRPVVGNGEPGSVYRPLFADQDMELSRRSSSLCAWQLTTPDKHEYCFDLKGFVRSIRAVKGESIGVTWETGLATTDFTFDQPVRTWEVERVKSVVRTLDGVDTHRLDLGYEKHSLLETVTVRILQGETRALEVITYAYDDALQLEGVSDEAYDRDAYEYSDASAGSPDLVVPLEGLEEFCTSACAMDQDTSCGGETLCAKVDRECPGACEDACATSCDEAYDRYWEELLKQTGMKEYFKRWTEAGKILKAMLEEGGDNPWVRYVWYEQYVKSSGIEMAPFAFFVWAVPGTNFLDSCNASCSNACLPSCSGDACGSECLDACRGSVTDSRRYVYGQPTDLATNLTKVTDGAGIRVVE